MHEAGRRDFLSPRQVWCRSPSRRPVGDPAPHWGGPVVDTHLHLRDGLDANYVHCQGCGVSHAVLSARDTAAEQVRAIRAKYPKVFVWTASADVTKPEAEAALTAAVKHGAVGLGEIKSHVAADGPELRRMYALAADLNVSIMVHFQEVPHFDGEGVFATGFKGFEAVLKAFPRTRFIGHADAFWANVSADYANDVDYPTARSSVAASPTSSWLIIQICSVICPRTPATTRCRATRSSPETFCAAIRTS